MYTSTILAITVISISAISGLVIFATKRWIAASIESKFKAEIDIKLAQLQHELDSALETQKASLTKEIDKFKRDAELSEKPISRALEQNVALYEALHFHFGRLLENLVTYRELKEDYVSKGTLHEEMIKLLDKSRAALEEVRKYDHYSSPFVTVGIADTYANFIKCVTEGADRSAVDKLVDEFSMLTATMRSDLLRPQR